MKNKIKNSETLEVTNDVILRVKPEGSNMLKRFFAPLRMTKFAFTLAEVLITLAIIGVVAALTIPSLIQEYKAKSWATANSVFKTKFNQALKIMNTQGTLAGYRSTETFVEELSKNFKIANICKDKPSDCFIDKITVTKPNGKTQIIDLTNMKDSNDFGQDWGTEVIGLQFANGTSALLSYNPNCKQDPYNNELQVLDCVAILYDINAYTTPNEEMKDIQYTENVKKIAGYGFCSFEISGTCYSKRVIGKDIEPLTKSQCESEKSRLGITKCNVDRDYWAAMVKECGGVKNMASTSQIMQMASSLYGRTLYDGVDVDYERLSNMNMTKAAEYGIEKNEFNVWANSEYGDKYARAKFFNPNAIYDLPTLFDRSSNEMWAFCINDK